MWFEDEPLPPVWHAAYEFELQSNGKTFTRVAKTDVSCDECPMHKVSAENLQLVKILESAKMASDSAPLPFGPAHKWEPRFYDKVAIVETQRIVKDNAIRAEADKA